VVGKGRRLEAVGAFVKKSVDKEFSIGAKVLALFAGSEYLCCFVA
jgi:hypothetical protein